jgi:predicted transcriptional regulator
MFKTLKAKKSQLEEEPEKTLDLLDELLFTIHSTRANVLTARARKYEKRVERRKEKAKMAMRRANRGTFVDESQQDQEIDALFQDVSSDFEAPAPQQVKENKPGSKRSSSNDVFDNQDEETLKALNKLSIGSGVGGGNERLRRGAENVMQSLENEARMMSERKESDKKKTPRLMQGSRDAYNSRDELANDTESVQVFEEFKGELCQWFRTNITGRNNIDARGQYADYLNDKYLCHKLDPLPPSKTVSNVRRNISNVVEALGSASGNLNVDWAEKKFEALLPQREPEHMKETKVDKREALAQMEEREELIEEKIYPGRKKALMEAKQKEEEKSDLKGKVSNDSIGMKNVKFKDDDGGKEDEDRRKSNVEKAADERERIKKQYEKYKARRATLDDEQKVDVKKLKENEALQDDIRSLLSTIQERR